MIDVLEKELKANGFHQAGFLFSGHCPRNKLDVLAVKELGVKRVLAFFPWGKKLITFAKSKGIEYVNLNVLDHETAFFEQALLADAKRERCFVNCIVGGTSTHYVDDFALAKRGRFDQMWSELRVTSFRRALVKVRRASLNSKPVLNYLKAREAAIIKRKLELQKIARRKSSYSMVTFRRRK